jgi:hypothetical protein
MGRQNDRLARMIALPPARPQRWRAHWRRLDHAGGSDTHDWFTTNSIVQSPTWPGNSLVAIGIVRCVPAREQKQSRRPRAADDRVWAEAVAARRRRGAEPSARGGRRSYAVTADATDALTAAPARRTAHEIGGELRVELAGVCWLDRSRLTRVLGRTVARAGEGVVRRRRARRRWPVVRFGGQRAL